MRNLTNWIKYSCLFVFSSIIPIIIFEVWANINNFKNYQKQVQKFSFLNSNVYASIASANRATLHETSEFSVTVQSNSLGFRGKGEVHITDYSFIGDSYVFGTGVELTDHFISKLKKSGYSINNFGLPTAGTLNELAILKDFAIPKTEKKVILVFYPNDIQNNFWWYTGSSTNAEDLLQLRRREYSYDQYPRKPEWESQVFLLLKKINDRYGNDFEETVQYMGEFIGRQHVENLSNWSAAINPEPENVKKAWALTYDALDRIKYHSAKYGLSLEVIYLPYQEAISERQMKLRFEKFKLVIPEDFLAWDEPAEKIKYWAKKENIPIYDLSNYFRESSRNDEIYYDIDGHLTAYGHDLVFQYVKRYVLGNAL